MTTPNPLANIDPRILAILQAAKGSPHTSSDPVTATIPEVAAPPPLDNSPIAPPQPIATTAPVVSDPQPQATPPPMPQSGIPTTPATVPPAEPAQPGPVKSLLSSFLFGTGQAMLKHVGLPTDQEKQQIAQENQFKQAQIQQLGDYHQSLVDNAQQKNQLQYAPVPLDPAVAQKFGMAPGTMVPPAVAAALAKGVVSTAVQGMKGDTAETVAQINQGAQVRVDPKFAASIGMPELGGTTVSGKTMNNLMKAAQAQGVNHVPGDIGNGHTGIIDKATGDVIQDFGPSQRIIGAGINAQNRTVQVVNPNDPNSTIQMSPSQANATGAQGVQSIGYQTDRALQKYFTSGAGGANLTAFNTAIAHLNTLKTLTGALNNGDTQIINKVGNEFARQTGSSAPTNFDAVKTAVAGEIAKVFKGTATEGEIASINKEINSAESPQQLYGVINTNTNLMQSKRDALHEQYVQGKQGKPNFGTGTQSPASSNKTKYEPGFTPIQ